MAAACPLSSALAAAVPPLILDARLALRNGGLSLSLRIARFADIWLTREFFALISPENGVRIEDETGDVVEAAQRSELEVWRMAYASGLVHSTFQWLGEKTYEGRQIDGGTASLLQRYEQLIVHLDSGLNMTLPILASCGLQSVALAVALEERGPLLLCALDDNDVLPLCMDLEGSQLKPSKGVFGFSAMLPPAIQPILALARAMKVSIAIGAITAPRAILACDGQSRLQAGLIETFTPMMDFDQLDPWQDAWLHWEAAV